MRKLLLLALAGYLAYAYHRGTLPMPWLNSQPSVVISNDNQAGIIHVTQSPRHFAGSDSTRSATLAEPSASSFYRCDGRQHCSQMRSYQEALFFLQNCPNTKMDGDRDGIPCEAQFSR